jgi:hypothetical protein
MTSEYNKYQYGCHCTQPLTDFSKLTPAEKQRFCYHVHILRAQGNDLGKAQQLALSKVLSDDIPFE